MNGPHKTQPRDAAFYLELGERARAASPARAPVKRVPAPEKPAPAAEPAPDNAPACMECGAELEIGTTRWSCVGCNDAGGFLDARLSDGRPVRAYAVETPRQTWDRLRDEKAKRGAA
jgi:hypothetical protein